jgi:Mannosyltransferase (PIG-V)
MSRVKQLAKDPALFRDFAPLLIAAFVFISLSGLIGTKALAPAFGWGQGIEALTSDADTFESRFVRWDAGYYLKIAREGYDPDGAERAFFPLYPLLTRFVSATTGLSLLWSGWLISSLCFVGANITLYRWMRIEYEVQTARWVVIWFCFFPVSFYNIAFYPKALYLFTSITGIYFARRGQFIAGGICIALAGAARPVAFLLAIPYLVEFWLQRDFRPERWLRLMLGTLIAPLGMLSYLIFLGLQSGSMAPLTVYNDNLALHWKMSTEWPWVTLTNALRAALFQTGIGRDWFSRLTVWHDLLYALGGLGLAIWALRRMRLSLGLFFLASMIFFLTSHGPYGYVFEGMPRHVASVFPVYIALALATRSLAQPLRWLPIGVSIFALGLLSAWFASGRWVS